ncbi:hypothetical protein [Streptomyces sp. CS131]|uniref:hypothetical protein n=1 Tax=Streptomyces sp. CS131 TaxID=2162711 RepID=UPI0013A540BA|nr:hypothetical protein [Streptomyces sp. CS131]
MNIKRAATIAATLALAASGIALTTTPATAAERTVTCGSGGLHNSGYFEAAPCAPVDDPLSRRPTTFELQLVRDVNGEYRHNATVKCDLAESSTPGTGEHWRGWDCKIVNFQS